MPMPRSAHVDPRYRVTSRDVTAALTLMHDDPWQGQKPETARDIATRIIALRHLGRAGQHVGRVVQLNRLRELLAGMTDDGVIIGRTCGEWSGNSRIKGFREMQYALPDVVARWEGTDDAPDDPVQETTMPSFPIPSDALRQLIIRRSPTATRFQNAGVYDDGTFRGVTYTTAPRCWWWTTADGTTSTESYTSRPDARSALDTQRLLPLYKVRSHPRGAAVVRIYDGQQSQPIVTYTDQGTARCLTDLLTSLSIFEA